MALSTNGNMKNVSTQMARINTNEFNNVWIGGGKSDARKLVGEEFADITGGSKINFGKRDADHNLIRGKNELVELLDALVNAGSGEEAELEGVELVSLTSASFVIMYTGWMGSKNYLEFTGVAAEEAIEAATFDFNGRNGVDLKNPVSQMTIFDTDTMRSVFIGNDADTSA